MICHDPNDFYTKSKSYQDDDLYYQEFKLLVYSSNYSYAVRGKNVDKKYESRENWSVFETPSCMESWSDTTECRPENITKFSANFSFIHGNTFNVNVTWNEPRYKPDFYTLRVIEAGPLWNKNETYRYTIAKVS